MDSLWKEEHFSRLAIVAYVVHEHTDGVYQCSFNNCF